MSYIKIIFAASCAFWISNAEAQTPTPRPLPDPTVSIPKPQTNGPAFDTQKPNVGEHLLKVL